MSPVLSFIIPVYNVEAYLKKCINSILEQSGADCEVILVDDGSTDGSGLICDDFSEKNTNVRVLHQKTAGIQQHEMPGLKWLWVNMCPLLIRMIISGKAA